MEYSCHACAVAPNCSLNKLDKLNKQLCRTVGPSLELATSLKPLTHCGNVANLSLIGVTSITLEDAFLN